MKRFKIGGGVAVLIAMISLSALADDEQIAQQIVQRLQYQRESANLRDFNIGVQVDKGTVTMMGQVADSDQAMLALDIARRTSGVKLVVNDLYIAQPTQAPPQPSMPAPPVQMSAAPQAATSAMISGRGVATIPAATQVAQVTALQPAPQPRPMVQGAVSGFVPPANYPAVAQRPVLQPVPRQAPRPLNQTPLPYARSGSLGQVRQVSHEIGPDYTSVSYDGYYAGGDGYYGGSEPVPAAIGSVGGSGVVRSTYDHPHMPGYAWPSYATYPNYAALSYPHQYSATAWPYIGPFYPYPQVPLGWRKATLEWDDGWWFLDFTAK